jgi:hypothetical protein
MKQLIVLLSLFFMTIAVADHEYSREPVYAQELPALCSTPKGMQEYLSHMGLYPINISLGREKMVKEGYPVFMITQYENKEQTEAAAVIDIPSGSQTCLMYHTFDLSNVDVTTEQ